LVRKGSGARQSLPRLKASLADGLHHRMSHPLKQRDAFIGEELKGKFAKAHR
jgi:hypothetical protein